MAIFSWQRCHLLFFLWSAETTNDVDVDVAVGVAAGDCCCCCYLFLLLFWTAALHSNTHTHTLKHTHMCVVLHISSWKLFFALFYFLHFFVSLLLLYCLIFHSARWRCVANKKSYDTAPLPSPPLALPFPFFYSCPFHIQFRFLDFLFCFRFFALLGTC